MEQETMNAAISAVEAEIAENNEKMDAVQLAIGKKICALLAEGDREVPEAIAAEYAELQALEADNAAKKEKILELKGIRRCPGCGSYVSVSSRFCMTCGTKLAAESNGTACSVCGSALEEGARFCMVCGAKVNAPAVEVEFETPAEPEIQEELFIAEEPQIPVVPEFFGEPETVSEPAAAEEAAEEPETVEEPVIPEVEEIIIEEAPAAANRFCPECGAACEPGDRFCMICGFKLN